MTLANFFDQFDSGTEIAPSGRPRVWVSPDQPSPFANAISSVESGGNYRAIGPDTGGGNRALGKYQVMASNVGPWSKEVLGQEITPQQFLENPEIQDRIFNAKFGAYAKKYGPEGAARAWFAGEGGMNDPNRKDVLGTTVADYGRRFVNALGPSQANAAEAVPQGNYFDSFDQPKGAPQGGGRNFFDQFDSPMPQPSFQPQGPNGVPRVMVSPMQRFGEFDPPSTGASDLQSALTQKAADLTTGPRLPSTAQQNYSFMNVLPAATQGTDPNIERYNGQLISSDVFESDSGEVLYRDPADGQVKPTDSKTQVAIRDPRDGQVKIFSRTAATNENPAVGVSRVLTQGMVTGAPTARPGLAAPSVKAITPRASEIMSTAKPYYRAFDQAASTAGQITQDMAKVMVDRIQNAMDVAHYPTEVAKQAHDTVSLLGKREFTTLNGLQYVKRALGNLFKSPDENVRNAAAVASKEIARMIGEISKPAADSLKTGDAIYSTAKSVQELQRGQAVAGLRAGRAGYGGNSVNSMRQVLSPIVEKAIKGRVTGFQPSEIDAMRQIVEGTPTTNALRLVGQAAPSKGIIPTVTGMGAGGAAGAFVAGPAGTAAAVAIPALGSASNKLAAILTSAQIDRLSTLVAKRSPAYAAAVAKASERFFKAQSEMVVKPTPAKLAAFISASRALSAGLTRDGIAVSSGDLLRTIQGPVKSAADEEQPPVPRGPGE